MSELYSLSLVNESCRHLPTPEYVGFGPCCDKSLMRHCGEKRGFKSKKKFNLLCSKIRHSENFLQEKLTILYF